MAIGLLTAIRNSRLQLVVDAIDNGADEYSTALLRIYSGDRPVTGGALDEYDNELLVEFLLSFPCGVIDDGVLTFGAIEDQIALAYGIATWARIVDESETFVMDLLVTEEGGVGDVKINDTEIFVDGVVHCLVAIITEGNV
jgi:hypothetical protein